MLDPRVGGEKCQWHFGSEQTLENLFFKDVFRGSQNVSESLITHQFKNRRQAVFTTDVYSTKTECFISRESSFPLSY